MHTITKIDVGSWIRIQVLLTVLWFIGSLWIPYVQESTKRIAEIKNCIAPLCSTSDKISDQWINIVVGFFSLIAGGVLTGFIGGFILVFLINLLLKWTGGFKFEMKS